MIRYALFPFIAFIILSIPVFAETQFSDVPAGHWAAESVTKMSEAGIMKGYPDGKFNGDKPVTRYELAVALERFAQFIEASRAPLTAIPSSNKPDTSGNWAKPSLGFLLSGGFLPRDSELTKDGGKAVSGELLAQSLASVAARLATLEADRKSETSQSDVGKPSNPK
ncbi:MAG: S-layer homology domain-containing protein [Armatimonadota bacterium]|nr:S-layer homology domain-containing protein [Armatimonadota bacterium]